MRPRGGYIGFNRVPAATAANSAASGVWTLREAEALKRAGTWPFYELPVTFLANFDTSIADVSQSPVNLSVNGSVSISSSVKKYGAGSAQFSGGDLSATSGSQFSYSGDFTIEGWFYFTVNNVGYQPLLGTTSGTDQTGWALILETNNALSFYGSSGTQWSSSLSRATSYIPPTGQFIHIAVVRSGTSLNLYADGVNVTTAGAASSSGTILGGTVFRVGGYLTLNKFQGYMDDLRINRNTAVYPAVGNFTPPSAPLTA